MKYEQLQSYNILNELQSSIVIDGRKFEELTDPELKIMGYETEFYYLVMSVLLADLFQNQTDRLVYYKSIKLQEEENIILDYILEFGFSLREVKILIATLIREYKLRLIDILDRDLHLEMNQSELKVLDKAKSFLDEFLCQKLNSEQIIVFKKNVATCILLIKSKTPKERLEYIENFIPSLSELSIVYPEYKLLRSTSATLSTFCLVIARLLVANLQVLNADNVNDVLKRITLSLSPIPYDSRSCSEISKELVQQLITDFQFETNEKLALLVNHTVEHLAGKMLSLSDKVDFDTFKYQMTSGIQVLTGEIKRGFETNFVEDMTNEEKFGNNPNRRSYGRCVAEGTSVTFWNWLRDLLKEKKVIEQ